MCTQHGAIAAALIGVAAIVALALAVRAWRRARVSPEEKERRRRKMLLATGKMGDASLLDIRGDLLVYSYLVRGVEYTATQDISKLRQYMRTETTSLAGPVSVKYDARNPANSIVIAEEWSGLRMPTGQA